MNMLHNMTQASPNYSTHDYPPKGVFFSILTPSWNRIQGLKRLYHSLCIQQYRSFEWIVGDDGSTDGTLDYLLLLAQHSSFPVRVISSDLRIGKPSIDNLLLESVTGDYFICCDSDDWFLPGALLLLANSLTSHLVLGQPLDILVAPNITSNGLPATRLSVPTDTLLPSSIIMPAITGDATLALRTSTFASNRHLEVDFVVTESLFYSQISDSAIGLALASYAKVMDRTFSNSVSFSSGIKYCRGSAYSLRSKMAQSSSHHPQAIINLIRYSFNGDLSPVFFLHFLSRFNSGLYSRLRLLFVFIPIGFLFSFRDYFFGGLIKTHLEFDVNRKTATISYH